MFAEKSAWNADLELARRASTGDVHAQHALFRAHRERVHVVLHRVLGRTRDMEDLVQEAWVAVFRSLGGFRGESSLATWIDRIATRAACRHLTRRPPTAARLESVPSSSDGSNAPDRELHLREVARRLYSILDRLKPEYRIAYALAVIDDRPLREVASITDSSLIATKNRVWRARRMVEERAAADPLLREFLQGESR